MHRFSNFRQGQIVIVCSSDLICYTLLKGEIMIHCPKCGFEQPPDTYCANCGINISKYQKLQSGKHWKRSTGLFYSFIFICILVAAWFFKQNLDLKKSNTNSTQDATISDSNKALDSNPTQASDTESIPTTNSSVTNASIGVNNTEITNTSSSEISEENISSSNELNEKNDLSSDSTPANTSDNKNLSNSNTNENSNETATTANLYVQIFEINNNDFLSLSNEYKWGISKITNASILRLLEKGPILNNYASMIWQSIFPLNQIQDGIELPLEKIFLKIKLDNKNIKIKTDYMNKNNQIQELISDLSSEQNSALIIYGLNSEKPNFQTLIYIENKLEK